ncbi:MAG: tetratricopeptide repeat protein [Magnetococcales bacterium]|nr:tetratricopeptide repeat protein [Magnetococcales bacterium]
MKAGKNKIHTPSPLQRHDSETSILQQALQLHQAGQLQEAEALYQKLLLERPGHQDALNLLGYLFHQRGQKEKAVEFINKAIAIDPNQALFYNNLGIVVQNQGKIEESIVLYKKAVAINPNYHAAYSNMGTALQSLGRLDEALDQHRKSLEINPDFFEAYGNIGNVLCDQGHYEESIAAYEKALAHRPDYVVALHNSAYVLQKMGRLDEAMGPLRQALAIKPDYLEAHNTMGNILQDQGRWSEAIECYQRALSHNPEYCEAICNMGNVLCDQGRLEESIACHKRALAIKPDLHESHTHMANALQMQGRMDEAIHCYQQALRIKPGDETALENLGVAYNVQGNLNGAIECNRQLLAQKGDNPNIYASLLNLLKQSCNWGELDALFSRMMALFHEDSKLLNPFVFLTLPTTADEQMRCARIYIQKKYRLPHTFTHLHRFDPKPARIRIGYLSCDFLNHATAILMAELIKLHDRSRFEILIYSYSDDDGKDMRQRIMASCDRFIDILTLDHQDAARRIAADGVHILVELKGFTKGARLEISALQPAPLQVNWLGYPGTMGSPCIDYIIADPFIIPHGEESHYSEKVVRLPHCYQPNDRQRPYPDPPTRAGCGLPESGLIFSNFNQTYKITPEIFAIWMRVLREIPGSWLWLLESNTLVADNLRREAMARGVDQSRLIFAPKLPVAEHLARYHLVDLVLDTFPVASHTTASDALWVGCPLVTCVGETFVSRVAGSLLVTMGLPELVTDSLEAYATRAIELGREPARLQELRARLQANRLTSPLFDTPRFTRHLEAAYEAIWQRFEAGLPADHIDIAPATRGPDHTPPVTNPFPDKKAPMPMDTPKQPIMLSICIPTYNRQELLAQTLDNLQWTLSADIPMEIIVSDNASEDDTATVAREKGALFPHFRYVRQPRNVGEVKNTLSVLRMARGRFCVRLADDDRLIPETLLSEIAYLNQHDDIIASFAPGQLWSDVTNSECGLQYSVDEPVSFGKAQSAELFNYFIARHIFPEIPIYRTASCMKVMFECHHVTTPFIMALRALEHGRIRFQPDPFCLVVVQSSRTSLNNSKAGVVQILSHLDQYRGALEMSVSLSLSNLGMPTFAPDNRGVVLESINDFIGKRIRIAANIAQAQGDFIGATEFLHRGLLWERDAAERARLGQSLQGVMTGAIYQSMVELFHSFSDARHLVLCELSNAEVVQASFRQMAPELPTVIRDTATALAAQDREACLYFTEPESTRLALHESGIAFGRVVTTTDLLLMFRVPTTASGS